MTSHSLGVNLYYNSGWQDIAAAGKVYTGIVASWSRTGANQLTGPNPGEAKLSLKNDNGEYNPGNPMSVVYAAAGRNAPLRLAADGDTRWQGEAAEYRPVRDEAGIRRCEVTGGGILRRLGIGKAATITALGSTLLAAPDVVAYWPLTDGPTSTTVGAVTPGSPGSDITTGVITFGAVGGPAGAVDELPELAQDVATGTQAFTLTLPAGTVSSVDWTLEAVLRADPDSTTWVPLVWGSGYNTTGYTWSLLLVNSGGTAFISVGGSPRNPDGGWDDISLSWNSNIMDGDWHHVAVRVTEAAFTVHTYLYVDGILVEDGTNSGTLGQLTNVSVLSNPKTSTPSASIGHIAAASEQNPTAIPTHAAAAAGYPGEYPGDRFERVTLAAGITGTIIGTTTDSVPMGPQPAGSIIDVLHDCAVTDGGIWYEDATGGLTLRQLSAMYNQAAAATINVDTDIVPPLNPIVGDKLVRNDITAKRDGGSSARWVLDTGGLSVAAPPAGVGRYDTSITVNPDTDTKLPDYARWVGSQTTVEAVQYDTIVLDLDANPALDVSDIEIGTVIELSGVPTVDDPDTPRLLVVGIAETVGTHRRTIALTTVPAAPYDVGLLDTAGYLDCGATTTTEALDTTETGVDVLVEDNCVWAHDDGDYDIVIGGERMTVTAVSAATGSYPARAQTLTVTRSVNGVVKSHATGAAVHVAEPIILTL